MIDRTRSVALALAVGLTACGGSTGEAAESPGMEDVAATMAMEARARIGDSEAGQTLLRAIDAAGGLETWYATPTSAYAWEYGNVGGDIQFKSYLVADNHSRRMYHDLQTLGAYGDPQEIDARFAWDGTDAWIWPADVDGVNPRFWASTGYYFSSIPFVLADPGVVLESLPDEELDGVMYDMVRAGYEEGVGDASDTYTLYVDKESGRVRAIRYTVTFGGRPASGENLFYYDDYTTVDGLTVPTRFRGFPFADGEKGELRNEAWVTDISFRQPFDEAMLAIPEGGRIQPMPGGN
ncbi:MAG: hypothetical protein MJB57_12385 [Gemmatimonadetes bacterium]|nr:hypothetical protein [Gemmatimonadota bacterium]